MYKQTHVGNPIYSFMPVEVEGFDSLAELALDMVGITDSEIAPPPVYGRDGLAMTMGRAGIGGRDKCPCPALQYAR